MRGLFVFAGVLGLLLLGANIVGEDAAEQRIEDGVRAAFRGKAEPEADIRGGVFLLQLVRGRFGEVTIRIPELVKHGVNVNDIDLTLSDVDFALSSVVEGQGEVDIGSGRGSGTISADALQTVVARQARNIEVTIDGDTATLSRRGRTVQVDEIAITGRKITLETPPLRSLTLGLPPPPRGFRYGSVEVVDGGLLIAFDLRRGKLSF